jgi:hypothetical protein
VLLKCEGSPTRVQRARLQDDPAGVLGASHCERYVYLLCSSTAECLDAASLQRPALTCNGGRLPAGVHPDPVAPTGGRAPASPRTAPSVVCGREARMADSSIERFRDYSDDELAALLAQLELARDARRSAGGGSRRAASDPATGLPDEAAAGAPHAARPWRSRARRWRRSCPRHGRSAAHAPSATQAPRRPTRLRRAGTARTRARSHPRPQSPTSSPRVRADAPTRAAQRARRGRLDTRRHRPPTGQIDAADREARSMRVDAEHDPLIHHPSSCPLAIAIKQCANTSGASRPAPIRRRHPI